MRRKIYLCILCIVVSSFHIYAQNYWLAEFDYEGAPACELFCGAGEAHPQDDDRGFLLAGFYNDVNHYPLIVRIDRFGNELWRKDIITGGIIGTGYKAAHYTDDKHFLIGGNNGIIKINSQTGDLMWNDLVLPETHGEKDQVAFLKQYADNHYLVLLHDWHEAYTFYAGENTGYKIDGFWFTENTKIFDAAITNDGNFIFVGEFDEHLYMCMTDDELDYILPFG